MHLYRALGGGWIERSGAEKKWKLENRASPYEPSEG
jgi:hypothetical protein